LGIEKVSGFRVVISLLIYGVILYFGWRLKPALIKLMKEKGYHSVTVKNIVDHASYNRSTFYTHYLDETELAEGLLPCFKS